MLLARARKGRTAIPEGFISRVVIALISLCLIILIVLTPIVFLLLLMLIIGFIIFLIGIVLVVNGLRLKRRMEIPKRSSEMKSVQ
jgi:Na+/proline symporter